MRKSINTTVVCALLAAPPVFAQDSGADAKSAQDLAEGFVEGSKAKLTFRNYFTQQKAQRSTTFSIKKSWGSEATDDRTTWIQAAMLDYRSGYTQGLIGVGVDASIWGATNLERGKGSAAAGSGGDRTLLENDGTPVDEWSRLAIADVRLRVSNTALKVGRFAVSNPMLRPKDNRSLPSTFEGADLISNDIENVTLQAGYISRMLPRTGSDTERFVSTFGTKQYSSDGIKYAGLTTKPWHGLSASVYTSRLENVWDRHYLGLTHVSALSQDIQWKNSLNIYKTKDQGSRELGYIDGTIASLNTTLTKGAHSFSLAYQQNFANEYFDYPWETSANFNPISFYSDFNGPNEKAASAKYDLDFAAYGVPGLTTSVWYAKGWDIDGTHYDGDRNGAHLGYNVRQLDGAKHWEAGLMASYVVQSGKLKDSSIRSIIFHHRGDPGQIDGSYDELRLIATAPFTLF